MGDIYGAVTLLIILFAVIAISRGWRFLVGLPLSIWMAGLILSPLPIILLTMVFPFSRSTYDTLVSILTHGTAFVALLILIYMAFSRPSSSKMLSDTSKTKLEWKNLMRTASKLEANGKMVEALAKYQAIIDTFPETEQATDAQIAINAITTKYRVE